MRTLILNGSPRPNGGTAALLAPLKACLGGRVSRGPFLSQPSCAIADGFAGLLA
ncbi:MAG: hypothetical protein LBD02_10355 [Christensenellaceae bacterium]|jgi:hypothetical protein|nr:hypothetical protein [Christensenellaceae bacterium]